MKFIVDFKDHLTIEEINSYLASVNGTILKTFQFSTKTFLVEAPSPLGLDSTIHEHVIDDESNPVQLLSTTIVLDQKWGTITLDGPTLDISTTQQQDWWKNYVIKNPKFDEQTYTIDRRGQGQTVYVLDSGCEITHPEFVDRPVVNLFSFNNDFTDTNGHGTAITSVITGATCGVTDATVKVLKIFDANTPTKQSDLVNALDVIYNDFINNDMISAIINCSWSISKNTFIESKLQILIDMGLVIVAASGNDGSPIGDVTPASMANAITIGSFNENLTPSDFSDYTSSGISLTQNINNHGALDGWAPGENIYAAVLNNNYGYVAGTSIAAGIYSAVCAYNLTTYRYYYAGPFTYSQYVAMISLSRTNLLDLSDPKYASSKNSVTTLHDISPQATSPTKNVFSTKDRAYSGTNYNVRICDPRDFKTVEILGTLPLGVSIDNVSMFHGKAPQVDVVTVFPVPLRLTNNLDETFEFTFELIAIPNDFTVGTDTTGDPELDIKLLTVFCIDGPCEDIDCQNNCGSPVCELQQDKFCLSDVRCFCNF